MYANEYNQKMYANEYIGGMSTIGDTGFASRLAVGAARWAHAAFHTHSRPLCDTKSAWHCMALFVRFPA